MKPHPYTYHRVRRVDDAVELLGEHGEEIKILAGGLSLVPMMNLRLASPAQLVDVNGVEGIDRVWSDDRGRLNIGALARHRDVASGLGALGDDYPILPLAGRHIGHLPIRARGTFGGSLAHCDPAAEWCVCAVLLDAEMHVVSSRGERSVPASQWFRGYFDPDLEPDEMLLGVTLARPRPHAGFLEYAQRSGDFAVVAVAVVLDLDQGRVARDARVVIGGVDAVPATMVRAQELLDGATLTDDLIVHAGVLAGQAVEGREGSYGNARYQKRLAASLTAGAIVQAAGMSAERGRRLGYRAAAEVEAGNAA